MSEIPTIGGDRYKWRRGYGSRGNGNNRRVSSAGAADECGGDQEGVCNHEDSQNQRSLLHGTASRGKCGRRIATARGSVNTTMTVKRGQPRLPWDILAVP